MKTRQELEELIKGYKEQITTNKRYYRNLNGICNDLKCNTEYLEELLKKAEQDLKELKERRGL